MLQTSSAFLFPRIPGKMQNNFYDSSNAQLKMVTFLSRKRVEAMVFYVFFPHLFPQMMGLSKDYFLRTTL